MWDNVKFIGNSSNTISPAEMTIKCILSIFLYLMLLIMSNETIILSINARFMLNVPLR